MIKKILIYIGLFIALCAIIYAGTVIFMVYIVPLLTKN